MAMLHAVTMGFVLEFSSSKNVYEVDISIIAIAYDVSLGEVLGHETLKSTVDLLVPTRFVKLSQTASSWVDAARVLVLLPRYFEHHL
jgi:hypothetical protein